MSAIDLTFAKDSLENTEEVVDGIVFDAALEMSWCTKRMCAFQG